MNYEDPWLGTNSGKAITLTGTVNPDDITLGDIGTGISLICRFNGQIKEHYSVAQHCLNVADLVPPKYRLEALLHDAAEAYICDIPTPLKAVLGEAYRRVEHRLLVAIGTKFDVDLVNLPACVKEADKLMCVSEHHELQRTPADWKWDEHILRVPLKYRGMGAGGVGGLYITEVKKELVKRGTIKAEV